MRILKIVLIALLVAVTAVYGVTRLQQSVSGVNVGPKISCDGTTLEVSVEDPDSVLLSGVTASDAQDGDLTGSIIVGGVSKLLRDDTAKVTYLVFDSDNNMAACTRYIRYTDYQRPVIRVTQALNFTSDGTAAMVKCMTAEDVIDGDISDEIRISTLSATDEEGLYSVVAMVTNSMGDTAQVKLPVLIQEADASRPRINLTEYLVYLEVGGEFDAMDYLQSMTVGGNTVTTDGVTVEDDVDTSVAGTYWVRYRYATGTTILTVVVQ